MTFCKKCGERSGDRIRTIYISTKCQYCGNDLSEQEQAKWERFKK